VDDDFNELNKGSFNPKTQRISLDFGVDFADPISAEMTIHHEKMHHYLTHLTDYGLATITVTQRAEMLIGSNGEKLKALGQYMHDAQIDTQETAAIFRQMQYLRKARGKKAVDSFVIHRQEQSYAERFKKVRSIFDASTKYRDNFMTKIPLIAMQTGLRERVSETELIDLDEIIDCIRNSESPDIRFGKLLATILKNPGVLNLEHKVICAACGISYFGDVSKKVVKDFTNKLLSALGEEVRLEESDVRDGYSFDDLSRASDEGMVLTNLNMNLAERAEVLFDKETFLFYTDTMKAIMISPIEENFNGAEVLRDTLGKQINATVLAFTKQRSEYLHPTSSNEVGDMLENELKEIPLLVKWGLYNPSQGILNFPESRRRPDAVIYNTPADLIGSFEGLAGSNRLNFLLVSSSRDHPYRALIIEDEAGVIRFINITRVGESLIFKELGELLKPGKRDEFNRHAALINACLQLWGNLDEDFDWFASFTEPG
jgi:hypothetical protein